MQIIDHLCAMQRIIAAMEEPPHLLCERGWLIAASPVRAFGVRNRDVISGCGYITGMALSQIIAFAQHGALIRLRVEDASAVVIAERAGALGEAMSIAVRSISQRNLTPRRSVADVLALKRRASRLALIQASPVRSDDEYVVFDRNQSAWRAARPGDDLFYSCWEINTGLDIMRGCRVRVMVNDRGVLFLETTDDVMWYGLAPQRCESVDYSVDYEQEQGDGDASSS